MTKPGERGLNDYAPTIRDHMQLLGRHKILVALGLLGVLAAAFAFTATRTPQFRAESEVLLRTTDSNSIFPVAEGANNLVRQASTERDFTESDAFRLAAEDGLGDIGVLEYEVTIEPKAVVSNDPRAEATTLIFTAVSDDADLATNAARQYADTYIELRHEQDLSEFNKRVERFRNEFAAAQSDLDELLAPLASLDAQIAASNASARLSELLRERSEVESSIRSEQARIEADIDRFDRRLDDLFELETVMSESNASARLTLSPEKPEAPFSPSWPRNIAFGLLLGGMLGVGSAMFRESIDDRIRTQDDLAALGLTSLGRIPVLEGLGKRDSPMIHCYEQPESTAADAYRALVTSIQFLRAEHQLNVIQVVSAEPGEGKTTTSSNLACAMANFGESVVIVDADMRKPRVHKYFHAPNHDGLSTILSEVSMLDDVMEAPSPTGVWVVPSGPTPPNPSELLGSDGFVNLIKSLGEIFQTVIVDSPPILPAPDARVIAQVADGIVLVAAAGQSTSKALDAAVQQIRPSRTRILGAVLNKHKATGFGNYEQYGYGVSADKNVT